MARKKRHKLLSSSAATVLPSLLAACSLIIICGFFFRGEFTMPSIAPPITRRGLLDRHMLAVDHLQTISPSGSQRPGEAPNKSPDMTELAPTVQGAAPPVQHGSPALQGPAPSISVSPKPLVAQQPSVPNVAVPSFPATTPVPTSSPVSSPLLQNSTPLVAPAPTVSQRVLPPVQSSEPKEHAFSPISNPSPPSHGSDTNNNSIASPPPQERLTHISRQNSSNIAPSPMVSQHVHSPQPKVASPPSVPASLSPKSNLSPSTKGHAVSSNTPVATSPLSTPTPSSHSNSSRPRGNATSPVSTSPIYHRRGQGPVSAPPKITSTHYFHHNNSHKADGPSVSPVIHKRKNTTHTAHQSRASYAVSPARSAIPVSASTPAPAVPFHQRKGDAPSSIAPAPTVLPKRQHKHHVRPTSAPVPSISPSAHSASGEEEAPSPSPSPISTRDIPYTHHKHRGGAHAPAAGPIALPQTIRALPPPPPNQNCIPWSCADPYTNSPPGSPCMCVRPIKVGLRLSVSLYKFFNLVSELAQEIASGIKMKQSQVRIMGANAATEDPDKTAVLVNLVPLGEKFDNITALLVFDKFWHKEVNINPSKFGDYVVLYVIYPGLPPSPPVAPDSGMGNGNKGDPAHPLAADISKQRAKQKAGIIAIIVLSSVFALILFAGAAWFVLFKLRSGSHPPGHTPSSITKASGTTGIPFLTSQPSSITASFNSNMVTYKGTAKTFTLLEMERATHGFDDSRLIGEGGFGRVYEGILVDGKRVAVKVLKRDDQQGSREFMAEVEMLSRLHHRNLVRLIGICTQDNLRCLVYELVPNGSVESHLHGADKATGPLDWNARLKIALGAARALAYLHEDSSPRVIHRDFKSSNILLEHDFTPKVSDFGLARAAMGEDNEHISTRVMGTFGYVAPEYAMTGHLLVKSDVYSYGVVLLELLTGRKPVDMFRPPGQENLVTWARPLLTNQEGLESIADPSLGTVPFDTLAKVAAIASMCVQPEVDQRPFMGEVVQALKLVCNEGSGYSKAASETDTSENATSTSMEMGVFGAASSSPRFEREGSGSFRVYVGSGPLKKGYGVRVWEKGSSSEHAVASRFGTDLEGSERYL